MFGDNIIPNDLINELNKKYEGEIYIMTSGKHTHFMDAATTVDMWRQCFTAAFARRRHSLGLTLSARGGLLYDGFTGN